MFKRLIYRNYRAYTGITFRWGRRVTPAGWLVLVGTCLAAGFGLDTTQTLAYQTFAFLFCCVAVALVAPCTRRDRIAKKAQTRMVITAK